MVRSENRNVQNALERLNYITGFATTLCRKNDPRARVFNRYDHINRMLWINQYFCHAVDADPKQSNEIIILHDLNRWPFAQNSEEGYFDQERNITAYLPALVPDIPEETLQDVIALHQKRPSKMRTGSRYAYIADVVAGMIEDPLLLITGLNTDPEIIPERFACLLGLDLSPTGITVLQKLCKTLNREKDINAFSEAFQELFENHCKKLIDRHIAANSTIAAIEEAIHKDALIVKKECLRPVIFPINNEKICHGSWIKRRIIEPLIDAMGFDAACGYLLSINEQDLLDDMLEKGYIRHDELSNVYPNLDYTSSAESQIKSLIK